MAKDTKAAKEEVTLETVNAKANSVAYGLRVIEKILKEQFGILVDLDGDKKKGGSVKIMLMVAVLVVALCGSAVAELLWTPVLNSTYGTCRVDSASGACTLTVDALTSTDLTTTTDGVTGSFRIPTNLIVGGTSALTGLVTTTAGVTVGGALQVTGVTTNTGAVVTKSNLTVGDSLTVNTNAVVKGTMIVTGTLTATGAVTCAGGTLTVSGNTAKLWLGTNGYFQVTGNALQFVGWNMFTNSLEADITQ